MLTANRLLGGITVAAGVAVWLAADSIQMTADSHTLSPRFFPDLLAALQVILGLALCVIGKGLSFEAVAQKIRNPQNMCLALCTLAFTLAFGHADYRLLCPVYIAAVLWILGKRRFRDIAGISVAVTAAMYLLFRYGFLVLLPSMG